MISSKRWILLHGGDISMCFDSESTMSNVLLLLMCRGYSSRCHGLVYMQCVIVLISYHTHLLLKAMTMKICDFYCTIWNVLHL